MKYSKRSKIHAPYFTKDGTRVPGVTTPLNELAKPALIHWAWDLGKRGIDYRVHRDELGDIGSLTHDMILRYLKKEECDTSEYSKALIDKAENCFLSFLSWEKAHDIEPILVEQSFVSEEYRFGGKFDFYGKVDGIPTLGDFKTGKRIYDEAFYQLAGYDILLRENGYKAEQFIAINIGRDENEKLEIVKKKEMGREEHIFFAALTIYNLKKEIKKGA